MIYLDNAATSWPKPKEVHKYMEKCLKMCGGNPGRGTYKSALDAEKIVYSTRECLAKLFNIENPLDIIFTMNATYGINFAIKGMVKPGDHVITTSMEHNAVARPLIQLKNDIGLKITFINCSTTGQIDLNEIRKAITPETRLIVSTHASNVTGTIMPIDEIGMIARQYNIPFLVDASQTAGVIPIDTKKSNIKLLAFPGHKGLMGPQGIGGLYVEHGINLNPIITGGTGSNSANLNQPMETPDRYESGTLNLPGIGGLYGALKFILNKKVQNIYNHEKKLTDILISKLQRIRGIKVYCGNVRNRVGVVSFNYKDVDSRLIGDLLTEHGIAVRTGLHCAPLAHNTIGTLKQGTVRFSMGYFNTKYDIDYAVHTLKHIISKHL
ncbi:MAG TPA: aminotransferase class V-fold PLP-dependent enzyme [Clostridiales bacterium]|nr:aminotransferase class V-fold PLP-dependent enzyme [Clostridiales bacterium]